MMQCGMYAYFPNIRLRIVIMPVVVINLSYAWLFSRSCRALTNSRWRTFTTSYMDAYILYSYKYDINDLLALILKNGIKSN